MPTIHNFGSFRITMYFGDPNPPHFHVAGSDISAKIRIDDLEIMAGDLPPGVRRRVMRWAAANRGNLLAAWDTHSGE